MGKPQRKLWTGPSFWKLQNLKCYCYSTIFLNERTSPPPFNYKFLSFSIICKYASKDGVAQHLTLYNKHKTMQSSILLRKQTWKIMVLFSFRLNPSCAMQDVCTSICSLKQPHYCGTLQGHLKISSSSKKPYCLKLS